MLGLVLLLLRSLRTGSPSTIYGSENDEFLCAQTRPITPSKHGELLKTLDGVHANREFQLKAYESLGGAVRIPTQTWDDYSPPGEDPRWEVLDQLHSYLADRFPLIHAKLNKTSVNHYALVYSWKGKDESLKPVLLTAHQDVVPVDPVTIDHWVHPPFSGYYDGEWIWGRGSCDDKSGLIASLTAVETLLEKGFEPTRTFVLAYGIDEERGGIYGATAIRDHLLSVYGPDSFSLLVDEGGGYAEENGLIWSQPAVAEKGQLNVRMEVNTPGGHSSRPPAHTGIGILASLITRLEDNPHVPHLYRDGAYYKQLQCHAEHDSKLPATLRRMIKESRESDAALRQLEAELVASLPTFKAIAGTTQAVDVIEGGVKVNALPEQAHVIVNHRIADYSSVKEVQDRFSGVIKPVVEKFNLSLDAFGTLYGDESNPGHVRLSDAFGNALNPAPVTPTSGDVYEFMSGTILATLGRSFRERESKTRAVVAPGLSLDTRHYWNLTQHIFRYGHQDARDSYNGAHTVNEAKRAEGFLEMIRFFNLLILNADESSLL
ncbi:carboxypeptidase S [Gloeophyllum trabeum ATCC 11539]|uniref:Carboxypeptidase S n=1 Tax=Gloeophyllum trabeum (strain ATCC 11539 / FP-39264 / Madison 617) TaxID=670483 RepID=S7RPY4_GLOTA|nr:carboxypeptidase S [Gloeophyllum trabeum ATCC 11539]EPQ56640.1 carboxypeptidase S [Gloeophyllum trabeum ATCC 11539]